MTSTLKFDYNFPVCFRWTIDDLVKRYPNIGLVIDLTLTTRYYNYEHLLTRGVDYCKIACPGRVLPSEHLVSRFFAAIDTYIETHPGGELVGVHCTHGVNRTGYMIARYLIQRMGFDLDKAIGCISKARGHEIERRNYVAGLKKHLSRAPKVLDDSDIIHASEPPSLPASKTGNDSQPLNNNSGSFRGRGAVRGRGRPSIRRGGPGHQWPRRGGGPPRNDHHAPFPSNNFVPPFEGPSRGNPQRYGGNQGHPGPWPPGGPHRNPPMPGHGFQGNPIGQDPPPPKFIKDILEVTQKLLPALGSLPQLASQLGNFKGAQRTLSPDPGPSQWGERNESSRPSLNEQRGRVGDRRSPYREPVPSSSSWRRSPSPRRMDRARRSISPKGHHADKMPSPGRRRLSPQRRNSSRSPFRRSSPPFGFQARSGSPPYQRRSRSLERRMSPDRYRQSSRGKGSVSPPRGISPPYKRNRYSPGPHRRTSPYNPFKESRPRSDYRDRPTSPRQRRSQSPLRRVDSQRGFGSPPRQRVSISREISRSPPRRGDWRLARNDNESRGRDEYSRNRPNDPNPFDSRPGLKAGLNPFNARSMPKSDYNPFHSKPSREADSNPFASRSDRDLDSDYDSRPSRKSSGNPFKQSTSLRESPPRMRHSSSYRDDVFSDEDKYVDRKHGNRPTSPLFSRKTPVGQRLSPGPDCRELILQKRLYSSPSSREGSPLKEGLLPLQITDDILDTAYRSGAPSYDRDSPDRFRLPAMKRLGTQNQNPFERSNQSKKPVFNRLEGKQSSPNFSEGDDSHGKRGRFGDQGGGQNRGRREGYHGGQNRGYHGGQRRGQRGIQRGTQRGGQYRGQRGNQRGAHQGGQR
ncbi:dual specificity phosphatase 11 (RNA RNP complex 1-interacting) [Nesidiocoris tenuis]|uniref:Dual specificity phosphatase 11 (RNA RNP complex 1-interacting) n=1 Tax=Nesidiocoris tenuis TaxID=355587 RepID=A0ABN7BFP0_9HEMI|nr:dual specificity phosphatase 11 (RNA RNP complex 1-interacting) [Nesidiocoris tenuis]